MRGAAQGWSRAFLRRTAQSAAAQASGPPPNEPRLNLLWQGATRSDKNSDFGLVFLGERATQPLLAPLLRVAPLLPRPPLLPLPAIPLQEVMGLGCLSAGAGLVFVPNRGAVPRGLPPCCCRSRALPPDVLRGAGSCKASCPPRAALPAKGVSRAFGPTEPALCAAASVLPGSARCRKLHPCVGSPGSA